MRQKLVTSGRGAISSALIVIVEKQRIYLPEEIAS